MRQMHTSQMRADVPVVGKLIQVAERSQVHFVQALWIQIGHFWSQNCTIKANLCTFTTLSTRFFPLPRPIYPNAYPDMLYVHWLSTTYTSRVHVFTRMVLYALDFRPLWSAIRFNNVYQKKHDNRHTKNQSSSRHEPARTEAAPRFLYRLPQDCIRSCHTGTRIPQIRDKYKHI